MVAVFGADHIYRMDIRQVVYFHNQRDSDVTIAARPVPLEDAKSVGVIAADQDGRIQEFQEKPETPAHMPRDPEQSFTSVGNYIFDAAVLLEALEGARKKGKIRNSNILRESVIEDGVELEDRIIMDYVRIGKGARLRRVIVDRHNIIEVGPRFSRPAWPATDPADLRRLGGRPG